MTKKVRKQIKLYGIVQGIGFRPFVKRLADQCRIAGTVQNKGSHVVIDAEGLEENLADFTKRLIREAPKVSDITQMKEANLPAANDTDFIILESAFQSGVVFVSPDLSICDECFSELFDPENRRYLHPFINCTNCGPRLTITEAMPYDRERTAMKDFSMCDACEKEYTDVSSRRYHAQPICCPEDGPGLYLIGREEKDRDAMIAVRDVIRKGGIAAVKGIGGFHLCCDATNEKTVAKLRIKKNRPAKPFAVMFKNIACAETSCFISSKERALLSGARKPIVILKKKKNGHIAAGVAPDNKTLGVMLPYSPLHALLFDYPDGKDFPDALIMTSGNAKDEPIARDDADAESMLSSYCDVILSHNRDILLRADDSVVRLLGQEIMMIRRSRGYAPMPVEVSSAGKTQILAIGGELKNTFVLTKDRFFYPSPYIGDMGETRGAEALFAAIERMKRLLEIQPVTVACDLHPGYHSREIAESLGLPVVYVQHHFAHILSCMAENDVEEPVIGVAFDGTGYGTDGTIWGGEFLIASPEKFWRIGSIKPFKQSGGEQAVKEGYRVALAILIELYGEKTAETIASRLDLCDRSELRMTKTMIQRGVNTVTSTSVGRLFDAASALLGIKKTSTYEGEAAVSLENAANDRIFNLARPQIKPIETETLDAINSNRVIGGDCGREKNFEVETDAIFRSLVEGRLGGEKTEILAAAFHQFMAECVVEAAIASRHITKINKVALSGGVFQNGLLLSETTKRLKSEGFEVISQHEMPANDGGIALGQAYYASVASR